MTSNPEWTHVPSDLLMNHVSPSFSRSEIGSMCFEKTQRCILSKKIIVRSGVLKTFSSIG